MPAVYRDAQFPQLRGKRILIVEDEALIRMLVEDEFLNAGAKVIGPACSVDEALQLTETAVAGGGLNAAVLDINLAGKAVWPVADRLVALGVPFVFSTGYEDERKENHYVETPRFIKPYNINALLAMVQELTSEATTTRQQAIQPDLLQAS